MSKSDFISQMVEETIAPLENHETNVLSFENPALSHVFDLEYSEFKKCLILKNEGRVLEIPKNWGPFKNRISKEISISAGDDKYLLLSMLSIFFDTEISHAEFKIQIDQELNKAA